MKKYIVTEWGALLDVDVNGASNEIVYSNPNEWSECLRYKYSSSVLFSTKKEAWLDYRSRKLNELNLEYQNLDRIKDRIQTLNTMLDAIERRI